METTLQAPARAAETSRARATSAAGCTSAPCCVPLTFTAHARLGQAIR